MLFAVEAANCENHTGNQNCCRNTATEQIQHGTEDFSRNKDCSWTVGTADDPDVGAACCQEREFGKKTCQHARITVFLRRRLGKFRRRRVIHRRMDGNSDGTYRRMDGNSGGTCRRSDGSSGGTCRRMDENSDGRTGDVMWDNRRNIRYSVSAERSNRLIFFFHRCCRRIRCRFRRRRRIS